MPDWAFRYCGSTMEYTDAPDTDARLRGFAENCREMGIRAGGFYLSSGYTQIGERRCVFHWNRDKIPSPEGLAAYFRAHGLELIPNVKPAFLTEHPLYDEIAEQGWFLHYADGSPARFPFWGGMASYLDFTNPGAYAFWKACVREQLVDRGYRHIWNDNNEYDVWDGEVLAEGFGRPLPARRIRPLFSYLMARASREACLEAGVETPFNVSRCAMAGTQRVASTWTGDNLTDFDELRYNHRQAMTMALTGLLASSARISAALPGPSRTRSCSCAGCSTACFSRASCSTRGSRARARPCPGSIPSGWTRCGASSPCGNGCSPICSGNMERPAAAEPASALPGLPPPAGL